MLNAVFEEDRHHSTVFYTKVLYDRVDEILEDSGVDFLDELLIVDVPFLVELLRREEVGRLCHELRVGECQVLCEGVLNDIQSLCYAVERCH